ncbi:MAG: hypothetical protein KKG94_05220 [Nanoarchaeota archaeon]|nr:hypothetical protein [Nanoarchaeota archaeon]
MTKLIDKGIKEIEIYIDEIDSKSNFNYIALGVLYINKLNKNNLIKNLLNKRCRNPLNKEWNKKPSLCQYYSQICEKNKYHILNSKEIHFRTMNNGISKSHINLCKDWVEIFKLNRTDLMMNILFLDLKKLDLKLFGDEKSKINAYARFLRTAINYGIKSFFGDKSKIKIKKIYCDHSDSFKRHRYFSKSNINQIKDSLNVDFSFEEIEFIDSDHKKSDKYEESNLIQFVDLILGCSKQGIFNTAKNSKPKNDLALNIKDFLLKLQNLRTGIKNFRISFFPRNNLRFENDLFGEKIRSLGEFYSLNEFDLKIEDPKNRKLDNWF